MIRADEFLEPAIAAGFDFYTGVPCSFLTPLINRVINRGDIGYLPAASEGEAVAIAAGAWLDLATTGKSGCELFTLADRPAHLYQVGSMGGPRPSRDAVLDGDGAALMKLGNFATIGAQAPENLVHIVLDNGVHDSTGGQATVSAGVDFARIALACGYAGAAAADDPAGFEHAFAAALNSRGPYLIHIRIRPGSRQNLGRPNVAPDAVARRFRAFLQGPV